MDKEQTFALHFDATSCTGCAACVSACSFGAIDFTEYPEIDATKCRLCSSCVAACPTGALTMDSLKATPAAESEGIWVLAEVAHGELAPVALQLVGEARRLAGKLSCRVEAVLVGAHVAEIASELVACGADIVHVLEHPLLATRFDEHCTDVVAHVVRLLHPSILLVGATEWGRGVAARLAATLHTGLTADCTQLDIEEGTERLLQIRPAFGGNLMATIVTPGCRPQMASVRPGVMEAARRDDTRQGTVRVHDLTDFPFDSRVRLVEQLPAKSGSCCALENSRVVVGVGRGVRTQKVLDDIRRFADRIGATLAASRAAVEAGMLDASVQVGQTGHTIAPDVYIALGVSGQIQHVAAIAGARKVIAVNRDASAPIFQVADYGWVGDIEDALPALLETFQSCGR